MKKRRKESGKEKTDGKAADPELTHLISAFTL